MTVMIEEGRWYSNESGTVQGVARRNVDVGHEVYPWRIDGHAFCDDGHYRADKLPHERDLKRDITPDSARWTVIQPFMHTGYRPDLSFFDRAVSDKALGRAHCFVDQITGDLTVTLPDFHNHTASFTYRELCDRALRDLRKELDAKGGQK